MEMFSILWAQTPQPIANGELRTAMALGDLAMVQKLMAGGADPNIGTSRPWPLTKQEEIRVSRTSAVLESRIAFDDSSV
jgi:hypothetical protein